MNILVTGGAGFIGSHIVDRYLELGHSVTIIDNLSTGKKENINPKASFIEMDIKDEAISKVFEDGNFDILSHQAAQMDVRVSVSDPKFDAHNNIIGSLNLYENCNKYNVKKIIFASSGGTVYGEQNEFPCAEEHPKNPVSPYGIGKLTNEYYLYYYKQVYGIDYAALRYGNVFGPRQNPNGEAGVIAIFANKFIKGEQPIINGDGLITRDYIYISDVVEANVKSLDESVSGSFNVTTGIETNVNEIFNVLKDKTNSTIEEFHGPAKKGEQRRSVCSFSKFEYSHNWSPKVNFEDGIDKTVKYFKSIN
ncbi:MAG: NAD-dependent epimerase/dehydratase family protein [Chlorobiota bacterium]